MSERIRGARPRSLGPPSNSYSDAGYYVPPAAPAPQHGDGFWTDSDGRLHGGEYGEPPELRWYDAGNRPPGIEQHWNRDLGAWVDAETGEPDSERAASRPSYDGDDPWELRKTLARLGEAPGVAYERGQADAAAERRRNTPRLSGGAALNIVRAQKPGVVCEHWYDGDG
jgi:hypothetical protein